MTLVGVPWHLILKPSERSGMSMGELLGLTTETFQGLDRRLLPKCRRISTLIIIQLELLQFRFRLKWKISRVRAHLIMKILDLFQGLYLRFELFFDIMCCLREKFKIWIILRLFSTFRYLRVKWYTWLALGTLMIFDRSSTCFGIEFVVLNFWCLISGRSLRAIRCELSPGSLNQERLLVAGRLNGCILRWSLLY